MKAQNAEMKAQSAVNQKIVSDLIAELARACTPPVVVPDAGVAAEAAAIVVRGDKVNKLSIALRMSYEVGEYEVNDMSIKEWLTRFDQEITALKRIYGVAGDLTRDEIVEFFKDRMDYNVIKRLDTAFAAKDPV